ncbi:MAG: DsrE family protein [Desulfosalsimonadaceae bacterium]
MKKSCLFVFNGDPMCFIHVLLNALDMNDRDHEVGIVIEGAATGLLPELAQEENPLHALWEKTKAANLIAGVCKACSTKMGTMDSAVDQDLKLLDDMGGHPSIAEFQDKGFDVITF